MLLGGPGGALLPGVQAGALGCFGTAVQEHEFSRTDIQQVLGFTKFELNLRPRG